MGKAKYKVRNWSEYNNALKARYNITLWINDETTAAWYAEPTGKRGAQPTYSDDAIKCCLVIRTLLHLPLRGCEGFLQSILTPLELDVPDYTTLSRRGRKLEIELPVSKKETSIHVVFDSSGMKIYGEGEWKVRMHGVGKRRTWRKLHIGVDEATGEILVGALTTVDMSDGEMLPEMLEDIDAPIFAVGCDGSYDTRMDYDAINSVGARALIPPRRGARIWRHGNSNAAQLDRDKNLRCIRRVGRKQWKLESGYSRRSLAETAFSRIKRIFGGWLRSRLFDNQATEAFVMLAILNIMTALGMPDSYPVL